MKTTLLFLVALALQVSFFPIIGWPRSGTLPLISILVVGLGFRRMAQWAVVTGFVFGVVLDILWGLPLGFSSIILMVIGVLASWLARRFDMETPLLRYLALAAFLLFDYLMRSLLGWVAIGGFASISLSNLLVALIVSPLIFFLLGKSLSSRRRQPAGKQFAPNKSPAISHI